MSKTINHERNFLKYLLENSNSLKKERIKLRPNGERKAHIRFSLGCGLSSADEFINLFKNLKIPFQKITTEDFSKTYKLGGYVTWQGKSIGVLYGIGEKGYVERKKYAPDSIGLAGLEISNAKDFRSKVESGLVLVEKDLSFRKCLISMLDNIKSGTEIQDHPFLKKNINKIKSDFGEVLAAYTLILQGKKIKFPIKSNNPRIDFWADGHPYSAKAPNGGGKVNLSEYKDSISTKTNTGKFLYSIATHNRDDFFKYAASLCPEVKLISEWVNGTSRADVKKYVANCSYDDHYAKMINMKTFKINNQVLGIPVNSNRKSTELTPKELWAKGSLEPFDFTINTIMSRFWGETNSDSITKEVSNFLVNTTFIHVDIVDLNIITEITPFESVTGWKTIYWSRATKAWHNWMAVEPIKESK